MKGGGGGEKNRMRGFPHRDELEDSMKVDLWGWGHPEWAKANDMVGL